MDNNATTSIRTIGDKVIIVQILIVIFLYINFLLILTCFKKEYFRTNMRYIFFATTLISDSLFLILTNVLLILSFFGVPIQMFLCVNIYIVLSVYTFVTPLTLTVMTLERYVAICMPLRHGELCTPHSALNCILTVHGLSCIPTVIILSIFFTADNYSIYTHYLVCSEEEFMIFSWQSHVRSAMNEVYFLIMLVIIIFSYVKIVKVAKIASGESKKSSWKGLRTVILHAIQLLLCLIQLWCPFIEAAILQYDFMLYINVRYFNYIAFILAPKCLSPLVYGLRDEKFFQVLKYYALFGLYQKKTSSLTTWKCKFPTKTS